MKIYRRKPGGDEASASAESLFMSVGRPKDTDFVRYLLRENTTIGSAIDLDPAPAWWPQSIAAGNPHIDGRTVKPSI